MKGLFAAGSLLAALGVTGISMNSNHGHVGSKGKVILFLSTDCPVAAQYTPRIQALTQTYAEKGFQFEALFPNDLETQKGIKEYVTIRGYDMDAKLDLGGETAKKLGVTNVPSAVVLDANGKVLYRGGIDDSKDSTFVKHSYLKDALEATSTGKTPTVKHAPSFGCLLMPSKPAPAMAKVNYAEHIAPILNQHCGSCHRPGEVAPFSVLDYDTVKKWAPMIAQTTESRKMPPWKAVHGYGEFQDENVLTETEVETLKRWNEAGAPMGDKKKAPKTPTFNPGWALGKPDMVLTTKREHTLDAEGSDEYRNFVLDPGNKETLWVTAMDVKPGNRKIVHHVIAFIDTTGKAERKASETTDGKEGYTTFGGPGFIPHGSLGGWAPGVTARHTLDGTAFEVPAGAKIVMQVHYHRNGIKETDQTKLGLYFAKTPPKQRVELAWLLNPIFRLKPGEKENKVNLTYKVPADVTMYGSMPHMHLLGRSMKAEIEYPDGTKEPVVYVDDWDFNWQLQYVFKEPKRIPKGSKINISAIYDNSADNPKNPNNPPRPVSWGEQTTDEMFLLIVPFTVDGSTIHDKPVFGFGN